MLDTREARLELCNRLLRGCWSADDTHRPELRSDADVMPASAPRIEPRPLAALTRLDDGSRPVADLHRQLGHVADWLEVTRPSYEQVRVITKAHRNTPVYSGIGEVLL